MSIWSYIASVIDWVKTLYDNAIEYARSIAHTVANNIVNSAIGHVYSVVSSWLNSQYWNLRNWATGFINSVRNIAVAAWNWVQSAYWIVSNWIEARIKPIWDAVADWIHNLYKSILEWSIKTYNKVVAWAQPFFNWVKQQVAAVQGWIASVQGFIKDQINLFTSQTKERFTAAFDDQWDNFSSMLFDPFGSILAMIKPIFVELFCYSVAYALGTEKESLPPWPKWDQLTQVKVGVAPAIAPSGLVPPLSTMWVSGYRFSTGHRATDYGCEGGCPVFACHSGTIEFSGWSNVGYGNFITIRGDDWWTRYAHLRAFNVVVGQEVSAGHTIGSCNSTGNSTGNHLHLEIKYKGSFINPESVF